MRDNNVVIARSPAGATRQSLRLLRLRLAMTEKAGFSLLEIIVSLVILSTLAAGIFATVSFAKRVSIQAQQKAVAVSLIESKLSELKSKGAANLEVDKSVADPLNADISSCSVLRSKSPSGVPVPPAAPYCVPVDEFGGRMTGLVMAEITDDPDSPGYKQVLVVAKWIDFTLPGQNRIRTESAVTGVGP